MLTRQCVCARIVETIFGGYQYDISHSVAKTEQGRRLIALVAVSNAGTSAYRVVPVWKIG